MRDSTEAFQNIVERAKMRVLPKQHTDKGNILVAEGFFESSKEYPSPHYLMVWGIERSGKLSVGKRLYIEPHGYTNGVYRKWTRQERVNAVVGDALQFMTDEGKDQVYFG